MPKLTIILILLSLLISLVIPSSATASCVALSLAEQKEFADIIVLGRVDNVRKESADVLVEKYFKGHGGPQQLQVTGQEFPGTITSVDFPLKAGKTYLLYLKASSDNIHTTDQCMGSREVTQDLTDEEVAVLGVGESPNGITNSPVNEVTSSPEKSATKTNTLIVLVGLLALLGIPILLKRRLTSFT